MFETEERPFIFLIEFAVLAIFPVTGLKGTPATVIGKMVQQMHEMAAVYWSEPDFKEFSASMMSSSACSRNALRMCSGSFFDLETSLSVIKMSLSLTKNQMRVKSK